MRTSFSVENNENGLFSEIGCVIIEMEHLTMMSGRIQYWQATMNTTQNIQIF
jgi:hypothetical protein